MFNPGRLNYIRTVELDVPDKAHEADVVVMSSVVVLLVNNQGTDGRLFGLVFRIIRHVILPEPHVSTEHNFMRYLFLQTLSNCLQI